MTDPNDPYVVAWSDQFGALLRDKVRDMQAAVYVTGWTSMAHVFKDPYDDDKYRLAYDAPEYYLINLNDPDETVVTLNLEKLGVNR